MSKAACTPSPRRPICGSQDRLKQFTATKNNSQVSMVQDNKGLFPSHATCLSQLSWDVCSMLSSLRSTDWRRLLTHFNSQCSKEKERSSGTQAHGGSNAQSLAKAGHVDPSLRGPSTLKRTGKYNPWLSHRLVVGRWPHLPNGKIAPEFCFLYWNLPPSAEKTELLTRSRSLEKPSEANIPYPDCPTSGTLHLLL